MAEPQKDTAEVLAIPSNHLETYQIAADNLEEELWETLSQYTDLPAEWVTGILVKVSREWQELEDE